MGAEKIDSESLLRIMPKEKYQPMMKKAVTKVPDVEILEMLFSKEEQEWLQSQYKGPSI